MASAQAGLCAKKKFATETKQVLELFAKWLYQNREIFLGNSPTLRMQMIN